MAHVALTEEQEMLASTVARVVADHPEDADGSGVWAALVDLGVLGLRVPSALGGLAENPVGSPPGNPAGEPVKDAAGGAVAASGGEAGFGAVEAALVAEELGRGGSAAPFLGAVLALELLVAADGEAASSGPAGAPAGLIAEVLAGRPAGPVLDPGLLRLADAGIAVDVGMAAVAAAPADVGTAADARIPAAGGSALSPGAGAGGALDGAAGAAAGTAGGGGADGPVLVGVDPDGSVLLCTPAGTVDGVDLSRRLVRAALSPGAGPLGRLTAAARQRWEALALALLCADLVGTMAGALDAAVRHARVREQFGRPVGSFQAVAHMCAEAAVTVESARSVTWYAAWAVDALPPAEALHAARVAKAYCAPAGREVCETALQVWGGIGMTWECVAHRYLRRALLDRRLLGDERVQLAAVADRTCGPPPSPALSPAGAVA